MRPHPHTKRLNGAARRLLSRTAAAVILAAGAAGCGQHAQRQTVGRFLAYSKGVSGDWPAIWLARVDGTHARRLAGPGIYPVVSPDGRWVAFDGCLRARDLCLRLVSTSGGQQRLLLHNSGPATWSPRSDLVVARYGQALAAIDLAGHATVLAPKVGGDWSVSPDGRRVAYTRARPRPRCGAELVTVAIDGHDLRVIAVGRDERLVWGPPGIAVSRYPPDCSNARRIWLIAPDGSGTRPITPPLSAKLRRGGYTGLDPVAWAPDGRVLLAGLASEDSLEALRVEAATRRFRRLRGYAMDLSRDGRFALVQEGGSETPQTILSAPVAAGGRPQVLARGNVCCPSWNR